MASGRRSGRLAASSDRTFLRALVSSTSSSWLAEIPWLASPARNPAVRSMSQWFADR